MSGKQAKAKRKGAKKTAMKKTPMDGARLDEFILRDVRCFAGEHRVPIRPVTLLVGENSTGKTTFLGCYQKFLDMFSFSAHAPAGAFTRPPFHMGGFSDIARRTGKRQSREFQVGGVAEIPGRASSPLSLVYSFKEENGEADPFKLTFGFPDKDDLVIGKTGPESESGMKILMMGLDGPGFHCKMICPDFLESGMNYNMTLGCINMGRALDSDRKARSFMRKKFGQDGGKGGEDEKNQFIPIHGATVNFGECVAVAPIRPMPRRSYEMETNGVAEVRILVDMSRMSRRGANGNSFKWNDMRRFLDEFGRKSGMFSRLEVVNHGKGAGASFSLRVNVRGVDANIADVGYGVSQLLPFLARVIKASLERESKHFLFQQPEDHLHPSAQAEFTSFLAKWAQFPADWERQRGHTFLVETHSDYIIDRLRICVSNGLIPPEDVVILYFEPQPPGNVKIHPIRMDEVANLLGAPKNYRRFFVDEGDRLLGFKKLPKGRAHVRHR